MRKHEKIKLNLLFEELKEVVELITPNAIARLISTALYILLISPASWISDYQSVEIYGNKFISTDRLKKTVLSPYKHAEWVWWMHPSQIKYRLKKNHKIINKISVSRQLFPSKIQIYISEYNVVGVVFQDHGNQIRGFLSQEGVFIPISKDLHFKNLDKKRVNNFIGIRGINNFFDGNQNLWLPIYEKLKSCPVKIFGIDWRDPENLILETEIGTVYVGEYAGVKEFGNILQSIHGIKKYLIRKKKYTKDWSPKKYTWGDFILFDLRDLETPLAKLQGAKINPPIPDPLTLWNKQNYLKANINLEL
uniref:Cell division protein FtsQ n=1 Tax=Glaucocystis incrassata TaxID=1789788 RepID=A0A3G1IVA9_9EUKA|nr:cell division protein FtsQ [Glaucocystis incrassata]ASQ39977.1 cell division protein FtsQ [Glaucocystis incrassata]